jgi:hypothetical protein
MYRQRWRRRHRRYRTEVIQRQGKAPRTVYLFLDTTPGAREDAVLDQVRPHGSFHFLSLCVSLSTPPRRHSGKYPAPPILRRNLAPPDGTASHRQPVPQHCIWPPSPCLAQALGFFPDASAPIRMRPPPASISIGCYRSKPDEAGEGDSWVCFNGLWSVCQEGWFVREREEGKRTVRWHWCVICKLVGG